MAQLHGDIDILKYEPGLFANAAFAAQTLARGSNGTLSQTVFQSTGMNFVGLGVTAGQVIHLASLDGTINGSYEIVSVDNPTTLTVSVLRSDSTAPAIAIGMGSGLIWKIITFAPQAADAAMAVTQRLGLKPGWPDSLYGIEDLTDSGILKQASVFTAIAGLYGSLVGTGTGTAAELKALWDMYRDKQDNYTKRAEAAAGLCRLCLNTAGGLV